MVALCDKSEQTAQLVDNFNNFPAYQPNEIELGLWVRVLMVSHKYVELFVSMLWHNKTTKFGSNTCWKPKNIFIHTQNLSFTAQSYKYYIDTFLTATQRCLTILLNALSVITKKSINVVFFVVVILIKNEWGD